jgi:ribosome-associated protein
MRFFAPISGCDADDLTNQPMNDAEPKLCLDQFLKLQGAVGTGGQAKLAIQSGQVRVNGAVETRRRRKLAVGDAVEIGGREWVVESIL